ncbi:MAG: hypothetical protein WKF37_11775 [Bryobacteraceae bacterium]
MSHYIYTDSSGAECRLDRNQSGIWSSKEGIFLTYNPYTSILWFNDGSFWHMGCESSGSEDDAGTRYPTLMEDSNGNKIVISYNQGRD